MLLVAIDRWRARPPRAVPATIRNRLRGLATTLADEVGTLPLAPVPGPPSPRAGMFKTLVGKEIAVELKNDVALTGALSASLDMT